MIDEFYLEIAAKAAKKSECLRRQYGCVIVTASGDIAAIAHNDVPEGDKSCAEMGGCYRITHNIQHGERYETCRSVHAEQAALIEASQSDMLDGTMYLVGFENDKELKHAMPCGICMKMLRASYLKQLKTRTRCVNLRTGVRR